MQEPGHLQTKPYYPFLDIIRVLACFLVILLHVSAAQLSGFFPGWQAPLFYESVARMSVPLFFMISGFLLLDADIASLSRFYFRRYCRILIPFLVICILYYFTPQYASYSPGEYLLFICTHFVDYHLWYVYALIGVYLTLPFFISIIHGKYGIKLARLYLAFWILAYIIPSGAGGYNLIPPEITDLRNREPYSASIYMITDIASSIFSNFNLLFFYGFMGYLLAAWLIKRNMGRFTRSFCWASFAVSCVATAGLIVVTTIRSQHLGALDETFFNNLSPLVCLQAISFFIFSTQFKGASALLRDISDKAYWIYLVHLLLLRLLMSICSMTGSHASIITIPIFALITFATAYCSAIPLRAIEMRLFKVFHIS